MSGLGVATSPRGGAHLAEKRISALHNEKEKDVETEIELWRRIHKDRTKCAANSRAKKCDEEFKEFRMCFVVLMKNIIDQFQVFIVTVSGGIVL